MTRLQALLMCLALAAVGACGADAEPTEVPGPTPAGPTPLSEVPPAPTGPGPADTLPSPPLTASPEPGEPSPTQPSPTASPAAPLDLARAELGLEEVMGGFRALTVLTHAGDGSGILYAVEQRGVIHAIEPDGSVRPEPFLDIRNRVRSRGERGLLGLAFHPQFAVNGRLFVNYTDRSSDTVVSEFRADAGFVDPASERVLLRIDQPFRNHNGGMLAFGPDGRLYISTGDGGSAGDPLEAGQDLSTLLGAILRIGVDAGEPYSIPHDNPFLDVSGARPEIWAYGLRNPWRFSFDRQTGALFIADVGQGRWEEINAEPAGEGGRNYGWNVMEGPECFDEEDCDTSGLTMPVAWYPLDDDNCAIIGGHVYRGERVPALRGAYLFSDHCSGTIWALDAADAVRSGEARIHVLAAPDISPTSFGEDESGELYIVGRGGVVFRLVTPGG